MELASCHPSGVWSFETAPGIFENMYAYGLEVRHFLCSIKLNEDQDSRHN